MQGTINRNFYHAGKWYFPGDKVDGTVAKAAKAKDCLNAAPEAKSAGAAPENKGASE